MPSLKQLKRYLEKNRNLLRGLALIVLGMGIANMGWSVGVAGALLCIIGFLFIYMNHAAQKRNSKKHR